MTQHDLLIAGATGLIGRHALDRAAVHPGVGRVTALVRRPLAPLPDKAAAVAVDFEALVASTVSLPAADAVLLCLGTTQATAGSKDAMRRVDLDYTVAVAEAAHAAGARAAGLISSIGATDRTASWYLRLKAEVEAAVRAVGFDRLAIVRPSLLLGARPELRPAERLGQIVSPVLGQLMIGPLRTYRPVPGETVAAALLAATLDPKASGTRILAHDAILAAARAA